MGEHIEEFLRRLARTYGFERFIVVGKGAYVDLQVMALPVHLRGRGVGSAFLTEACREADRKGAVLGTCPEPLFPGWTAQDKRRLVRWYERFGFVESPDEDTYRVSYVRFPKLRGASERRSSPMS
jgi:GNAT superfamily N-acetyltransferase